MTENLTPPEMPSGPPVSPEAPSGNGKPRLRGWQKGLIFASLALNLAVIGVVAGAVLKHGPDGPSRAQLPSDAVIPYTRAFTEDERRALRHELRRTVMRGRPPESSPLSEYEDAVALLTSEPFDPEAFGLLLEQQGARADGRRDLAQQALVSFIADMTPEAREAYALRLETAVSEISERWRRNGGRKDGRPGGGPENGRERGPGKGPKGPDDRHEPRPEGEARP